GYDTRKEIYGHGFRAMACSALSESGRWSKEAIEKQMSHQERNSVRAAYIHKAKYLEERIAMMQWWADYLDASMDLYVSPYQYAGNLKEAS
ncbi:integrase, partial [Salmonella enterica]|nr:integrase [Salmonella enterica]